MAKLNCAICSNSSCMLALDSLLKFNLRFSFGNYPCSQQALHYICSAEAVI